MFNFKFKTGFQDRPDICETSVIEFLKWFPCYKIALNFVKILISIIHNIIMDLSFMNLMFCKFRKNNI